MSYEFPNKDEKSTARLIHITLTLNEHVTFFNPNKLKKRQNIICSPNDPNDRFVFN